MTADMVSRSGFSSAARRASFFVAAGSPPRATSCKASEPCAGRAKVQGRVGAQRQLPRLRSVPVTHGP